MLGLSFTDATGALAEQLHRVLVQVFLVLSRRGPGGVPTGDLTPAQLSLLMALRDHGPMRVTALAAHERVRTPTTTVAIHRLEKLGLVARSPDPADLRGVLVRITPHGDSLCRDALAVRLAEFTEMLTTLSTEDRATLWAAMPPLKQLGNHGCGDACQPSSSVASH
jgi:DNA-binding MarR family transcriptional regulator